MSCSIVTRRIQKHELQATQGDEVLEFLQNLLYDRMTRVLATDGVVKLWGLVLARGCV